MTTATANSSDCPFISTAAITLVRAMSAATDRSMPPEMTATVWPAAANAKGRTPMASDWSPWARSRD